MVFTDLIHVNVNENENVNVNVNVNVNIKITTVSGFSLLNKFHYSTGFS